MSPAVGDSDGPGRVGGRRAYTGRVISVDLDTVRFPDGSVGELEMVRHPGASAIVPFLDDPSLPDARILLLRQYRYAASGYLFEVPAGRLEPGELPVACAERELREETGYLASHFEHMMTMYTTPGFTDERIHVFRATGLASGAAAREVDEFIELIPTPIREAVRMIERGLIQDAKTALAILVAVSFGRVRG